MKDKEEKNLTIGPVMYELKVTLKGINKMILGAKLISFIALLFKFKVEFSLDEVKK